MTPHAPLAAAIRFAAAPKVLAPNGCILWAGGTSGTGYGRFRLNGKSTGAHRAAWVLANGEIPAGMCVMHSCDTRPCVNVDHLRVGTYSENEADKVAKGRHPLRNRTHCPNGHPIDGTRTFHGVVYRRCRTCHINECREYRKRNKA